MVQADPIAVAGETPLIAARPQAVVPVLPLLALVAGLVLRFWALGAVGFNSDEAVYAGQAANIAGDHALSPYFPAFRAHPMLFQTLLSPLFHVGFSDTLARTVAGVLGLAAVAIAVAIADHLYGRRAALLAGAVLMLMPYHVVVSRQVLLDGPMTMFLGLSLYLLARYVSARDERWLYASAAAFGLAVLSKETAIIMLLAFYAFFALTRTPLRRRSLVRGLAVLVLVILPFPLSLALSGHSKTGSSFLSYQLFRPANHTYGFYFATVPVAIGVGALVAALVALLRRRRSWSWRETLLMVWIVVPVAFFELYPIKGFQYLLPISIPVAVLAGRGLVDVLELGESLRQRGRRRAVPATVGLVALVLASLAMVTTSRVQASNGTTFLAGSGGLPGGRAAGRWIDAHVPSGGTLLTVGPSMANVLEFYGHRKAYALSISPNPLKRNPVYEPIVNPDLRIRAGDVQYIVWDSFSAKRSPFFAARLLRYSERYHGQVIHIERAPNGERTIVVYEVRS